MGAATRERSVVLAHRRIPGKTTGIPMMATLIDDLRTAGHDPASMVFTFDALHTQHATARLLDDAGYLMCLRRATSPDTTVTDPRN